MGLPTAGRGRGRRSPQHPWVPFQHPWVLKAAPTNGSQKQVPQEKPQKEKPQTKSQGEGWELTSDTGCRDKPSGGCRAPRQHRHQPALWGQAAGGHRVPPSPWPRAAPRALTLQQRIQQSPAPRQPRPRRQPGPQGEHFSVRSSRGAARPWLKGLRAEAPRGW